MEKIISIVILILYGVVMLLMCYIAIFQKEKKPKNNVHFYVARDKNRVLWLYLEKPIRVEHMFVKGHGRALTSSFGFQEFGLNEHDFDNLKWEDEPIEVFINLEE